MRSQFRTREFPMFLWGTLVFPVWDSESGLRCSQTVTAGSWVLLQRTNINRHSVAFFPRHAPIFVALPVPHHQAHAWRGLRCCGRTEFIRSLANTKPNHAVVDAVVTVDQFKQQARAFRLSP